MKYFKQKKRYKDLSSSFLPWHLILFVIKIDFNSIFYLRSIIPPPPLPPGGISLFCVIPASLYVGDHAPAPGDRV